MPSHASSQAHCSSGSSRTASDRLSRRRHSDGDTPIIEDRPSNSAPVRARNAAKRQKFQRRRVAAVMLKTPGCTVDIWYVSLLCLVSPARRRGDRRIWCSTEQFKPFASHGPGLRYRSVRLSRGVGPAWSLLQHLTLHWIDAEIETAITALGREPEGGLAIMPGVFMFAYRNLSGQPIAARPACGRKW
jgi:hypothetical protein